MRTVSPEQFKSMYGDAGVQSFTAGEPEAIKIDQPTLSRPAPGSLIDNVATDIYERTNKISEILNRQNSSKAEKFLQVFGQGAGLAANTAEEAAMRIPGVKQVAEGAGEAIQWLMKTAPIKSIGEALGDSKSLQSIVHLYDSDQNFKDTVDGVANIARLGGDVDTAIGGANFAKNVTNKVLETTSKIKAVDPIFNATEEATGKASANIMNRVARMNPSEFNEFKTMAGETPGEYLARTGNFGSPEKVIANEAEKFVQSKSAVDNAIDGLNGRYKNGPLADALNGLKEKAKIVASDNVKPDYANRVNELVTKYNEGGLTMREINETKRLYERNVKLGYNKLMNADKVETATNIDSALRKWQFDKAEELGLKNLKEMNKQTQTSKYLVDTLGEQLVGKSGLNSVNLTDWIVLGGGTPQSIAGFLTKKFFSSKAVQAKIAEILSDKVFDGFIKPDVQASTENIIRGEFPQGVPPALPPGTSNVKQGLNPIPLRAPSSIEPPAQVIRRD